MCPTHVCNRHEKRFTYTFKNEMVTCKIDNILKPNAIVPMCCHNRVKRTEYETCAKLHRFHILYMSRGCLHQTHSQAATMLASPTACFYQLRMIHFSLHANTVNQKYSLIRNKLGTHWIQRLWHIFRIYNNFL